MRHHSGYLRSQGAPDCPSCSSKVRMALLHTSADGDNDTMMIMPHLAMHNASYTLHQRLQSFEKLSALWLQEMVRPGLLAVLSPCVVGLTFRVIGAYTGQDLLGAKAVAGLLIFTTVAGTQHASVHSSLHCHSCLHQAGSVGDRGGG